MSETLSATAATLRRSGAQLDAAAARLAAWPAATCGGTGPGRLGELGRALEGQWRGAVEARVRELRGHAARLIDAGDTVLRAGAGYLEIDHQRRQPGGR